MNIRLRLWVGPAIPFLVAACTTGFPVTPGVPADRSLAVAVSADPSTQNRGTFDVTLTNVSGQDRCVFNDVLERPGSDALAADLRIGRRTVPHAPEGYLIPQIQGFRRLAPGETVSFRADLNGRFERDFESLGRDAEARIGVPHTACATEPLAGDWRQSWSRWTAVR